MIYRKEIWTFILLFIYASANGVEVLSVRVESEGKRYHMLGESIIQATPEFIFNTLMDYDNFHRLASGIAETRFLEPENPGQLLGYTRIDSCVLFFCKSVEKVETIHARAFREISTEAIPEKSDFVFNKSRWSLEDSDDGTHVTYEAEIEPDFWMPPLITKWAIRYKLRKSAELIGLRIEYLEQNGIALEDVAE
ncbi:MAG: SRPBCC family protein [Gammaproteobacteria bacterium]|nr:SRPBCC family protein [Gammaproteobacteria bacterium]